MMNRTLLDVSEKIYLSLPCIDEYNNHCCDCSRCKNKEMCDALAFLNALIKNRYL